MNTTQHAHWLKQLRSVWEEKATDELLAVWRENNRREWTDGAFEAIEQILLTRLGHLPPQDGAPVTHSKNSGSKAKRFALALALIAAALAAYLFIVRLNSNIQVLRDETHTVALTQSTHAKRLIFENDAVVVSVGYDQFLNYIDIKLREYDGITPGEYLRRRDSIENKFRDRDTVTLDAHDDRYLIAGVLEEGQASVFDKRSQSYLTTINVRTYAYVCGALCGNGRRYFFLPDGNLFNPTGTQFLEVLDWIS